MLHFYQPWWQFTTTLRNIVNQCYRPILRIVNEIDEFCLTANINLSLLDLLLEKDFPDVIAGFREAVRAGKIELMGSPAHHPILPLIPDFLKRAQIEEDERRKESQFNLGRNCRGFYLPEMAFSRNDVDLLKDYGYKWTVVDDEPFRYAHVNVPFDHIVTWNGFKIYLRSRLWSYGKNGHEGIAFGRLSFDDLKTRMEHEISSWTKNNPAYIVLAMDAETFGHHHSHLCESFLEPFLKEWSGNKIVRIENLELSFPSQSVNYIPDGSWSTHEDNLKQNDPYHLWNSRFNIYHDTLWKLVHIALRYYEKYPEECLKITSSCHWWWIAGYPHPYWNPSFMMLGAKKEMELIGDCGLPEEKEAAEIFYEKLKELR